MKKTVLLVPGFQESFESHDYNSVISAIKSKGHNVAFVPIRWTRTTIDDWKEQLKTEYSKYPAQNTILAGFSYGAMTALVTAADRNPSELWLFSLSPYFSEDILLLKLAWLRMIGKQRQERFWRLSFNSLAPLISCHTLLFVGEKESDIIKERANAAHELIKNSKLIVIPKTKHDVTSESYVQAIKQSV